MFGPAALRTARLVEMRRSAWRLDRFALGSYSYVPVGTRIDRAAPALAAPEWATADALGDDDDDDGDEDEDADGAGDGDGGSGGERSQCEDSSRNARTAR